MRYRVRFTQTAEANLVRLYGFILERDETGWALAERALEKIKNAIRSLQLSRSFHSGASGYVALFEIDNEQTATVLA